MNLNRFSFLGVSDGDRIQFSGMFKDEAFFPPYQGVPYFKPGIHRGTVRIKDGQRYVEFDQYPNTLYLLDLLEGVELEENH